MLPEVCALLLTLLLVYRYFKCRKVPDYLKTFPTLPGLPLIGIAHHFSDPKDCLKVAFEFYKLYGPIFIAQIGPWSKLVINEPKFLELILGSPNCIAKSDDYRFTKNWFGDGLLTSTGYKWKSHRKVITPTFHYNILDGFLDVFNNSSDKLVKKLQKELGNHSFNIYEYVTICTLDVICETAMGTSLNIQENPTSLFAKSVKDMCDVIYKRFFNPLLRVDWIYYFSSVYKMEKKATQVLRGFSNDIIINRRKELQYSQEELKDEFNIKRKTCFLDMLLQCRIDGKPLTHQEIQDEVDTFIFEGHDTTGVAIAFLLYCLSKNLDVQAKVYEEIITILGTDKKTHPTRNDLLEMKYLEMVIKETLRLYPSVPGFARVLTQDVIYENVTIPKGVEIAITPYAIHRDAKIYPDPEKFIPERFSLENCAKRPPYAYIPFSAGPRNCIGQKFALLEMKSTISAILRHYQVLPSIPEHEVHLINKATIQSANGIHIRLQERV